MRFRVKFLVEERERKEKWRRRGERKKKLGFAKLGRIIARKALREMEINFTKGG